jgi:hypothetical protein
MKWAIALILTLALSGAGRCAGEFDGIPVGAAWELRALGVGSDFILQNLRKASGKRRVVLGIVGTGGVSKKVVSDLLDSSTQFTYAMAPDMAKPDPESNTHDTQELRVIWDLTKALRVPIIVRSYQEADEPKEWAKAFALAGSECDIVVFFESYWDDIQPALTAIKSSKALFLCPYGEVGDRPTKTAVQGYSAKHWADGIPNLLTCAPLARKGPTILTLLDRPGQDIAVVNLIAPSYYANGPGGTCPSAAVATAVACYVFSAMPAPPKAVGLANMLRSNSTIDLLALESIPEFGKDVVDKLTLQIGAMSSPKPGERRKLDARGVLSLKQLLQQLRPRFGGGRRP